MTITEAIHDNVRRLTHPHWSARDEYIRIEIDTRGGRNHAAPWVRLFSPVNAVIGQPNPQLMLIFSLDPTDSQWEPYAGALDAADTH